MHPDAVVENAASERHDIACISNQSVEERMGFVAGEGVDDGDGVVMEISEGGIGVSMAGCALGGYADGQLSGRIRPDYRFKL